MFSSLFKFEESKLQPLSSECKCCKHPRPQVIKKNDELELTTGKDLRKKKCKLALEWADRKFFINKTSEAANQQDLGDKLADVQEEYNDIKAAYEALSKSLQYDDEGTLEGMPTFYKAIGTNCAQVMHAFLDYGHDPSQLTYCNKSNVAVPLLHVAVEFNRLMVAEALLKAGVNVKAVDEDGVGAIHKAARLGSIDMLRLLLAHGAPIDQATTEGCTALHYAVYFRREDVVKYLLDEGLTPNKPVEHGLSVLHLAMDRYRKEIADLLWPYKPNLEERSRDVSFVINKQTPLHFAIINCQKHRVSSCCCDHVEYFNRQESYCSTIANGRYAAVLELLERGANPNVVDAVRMTPLHLAVSMGCSHLVRLLLKFGANPNLKESVGQLIDVATGWPRPKSVRLLLAYGVDLTNLLRPNNPGWGLSSTTMIYRHLMACKLAGMKIKSPVDHIEMTPELKKYKNECIEQIEKLKNTQLRGMNALHFLRANRRVLAKYMAEDRGKSLYDMMPLIACDAPHYKDYFEAMYTIGTRFAPIMDKALFGIYVASRKSLPVVILDRIMDFLSYDDMKNVITATQHLSDKGES